MLFHHPLIFLLPPLQILVLVETGLRTVLGLVDDFFPWFLIIRLLFFSSSILFHIDLLVVGSSNSGESNKFLLFCKEDDIFGVFNFGKEILKFECGALGYESFLFFANLFFCDVEGTIIDAGVVILFVFEVDGLVGLLDGLTGFLSADEAGFDIFEAGVVFVFDFVEVFLHDEEGGFLVLDSDYFFLTSYFYHIEKSNMLLFSIINVIFSSHPSSLCLSIIIIIHVPQKPENPPSTRRTG